MTFNDPEQSLASTSAAPLMRLKCNGCGYGASVRGTPERCPMCGETDWMVEGWRPFADLTHDLEPETIRFADAALARDSASGVFPGVPLT